MAHERKPGRAVQYCLASAGIVLAQMHAPGAPPDEVGFQVQTIAMGNLQPARTCAASLPTFGHDPSGGYTPANGAMSVSNDGGWCWLQFAQRFRGTVFVPRASLARQAANGDVQLLQMADRVSVAYRPHPGFRGNDRFDVRTSGPIPHTIPVSVTVR